MSNNLKINVSTSSKTQTPFTGVFVLLLTMRPHNYSQLLKESLFLQILFVSNYTHMRKPSLLCGTAQLRYSIHVFADLGLQTEEYQAGEEVQIHTVTQKVEDRHTDESTCDAFGSCNMNIISKVDSSHFTRQRFEGVIFL